MTLVKNFFGRLLLLALCSCNLSNGERVLQDSDFVRTDFVRLVPFDVEIAMTSDPADVNGYSLTEIVTDWLTASFEEKTLRQGLISNLTTFDSLGLELRVRRHRDRQLQDTTNDRPTIRVFEANFEGISSWERTGANTPIVDAEIVELLQRATFRDPTDLLQRLREADAFSGLGANVVDVRAFVVAQTDQSDNSGNGNDDDSNDSLQIIIIIAIVVACLAFGLLLFAVVWAWRTDQAKRQAYSTKGGGAASVPQVATGSESYDEKSPSGMTPPARAEPVKSALPPVEQITSDGNDTGPNEYDGSVLSEDISTSLTAYYRSGMTGYGASAAPKAYTQARELNDNASMSSMDSYGYSLDGYAPSLGPAPQGYPLGQGSLYNGMIKDPESGDDDEVESYS